MKIYKTSMFKQYGGWMSPTGEVTDVPTQGHEAVGINILKNFNDYNGVVHSINHDLMLKGWIRLHLQNYLGITYFHPPTDAQKIKLLRYINQGYDHVVFSKANESMKETTKTYFEPIGAREHIREKMWFLKIHHQLILEFQIITEDGD